MPVTEEDVMEAYTFAKPADLPHPLNPKAMAYPGWWWGMAYGLTLFMFTAFLPEGD